MPITYEVNPALNLDTAIALYIASTLGERRPVADRACMQKMLQQANLVVTAWDGDQLVGLARSLTDWCYCCYLADLAVRTSHQRMGIGRQLIQLTQKQLSAGAMLTLLAAPGAVDYYAHIGMHKHPSAWILRPGEALRE